MRVRVRNMRTFLQGVCMYFSSNGLNSFCASYLLLFLAYDDGHHRCNHRFCRVFGVDGFHHVCCNCRWHDCSIETTMAVTTDPFDILGSRCFYSLVPVVVVNAAASDADATPRLRCGNGLEFFRLRDGSDRADDFD